MITNIQLFSALVLALALTRVAAGAIMLYGPNNGDVLNLGAPYALTWDNNNASAPVCVMALLRCPRSNAPTTLCELAIQTNGVPNTGSYLWTPPTDQNANLNDGQFYRIQLYDATNNDVSTSGTFTFDLFPQTLDTT